jgi:hypothetical protein
MIFQWIHPSERGHAHPSRTMTVAPLLVVVVDGTAIDGAAFHITGPAVGQHARVVLTLEEVDQLRAALWKHVVAATEKR